MAKSSRGADNLVLLGRIGAAHGILGEVRIKSFTEDPMDITTYGELIDPKGDRTFTILKARVAKTMLVARLKGIDDRNAVELLNGVELYVPRDQIAAPDDEDEFLYSDLAGLEARLEDGSVFGIVTTVVNYGASDILEIKSTASGIKLLPFTKTVVPEVNVLGGYVTVAPPTEIIAQGPNDGAEDSSDETSHEQN